jgi:hypothetical protein
MHMSARRGFEGRHFPHTGHDDVPVKLWLWLADPFRTSFFVVTKELVRY